MSPLDLFLYCIAIISGLIGGLFVVPIAIMVLITILYIVLFIIGIVYEICICCYEKYKSKKGTTITIVNDVNQKVEDKL